MWGHEELPARNVFWDALKTLTLLAKPVNPNCVHRNYNFHPNIPWLAGMGFLIRSSAAAISNKY